MWINIDLDQMAIVHKHEDQEVLRMLAWIECQCATRMIPCGDADSLMRFTPLELQKLYESATGHKMMTYANHMAHVLAAACMSMPQTDADYESARLQRLSIVASDKAKYRYVKGAAKPEHMPDLFMPEPIPALRDEAQEANQQYRSTPVHSPRQVWRPDPQAAAAQAKAVTTPRQPREPGAPRRSGTRDTVFQVADEMWQAAGSPTDLAQVLKLRKEIMTALETSHDIKRTTSSNTLGEWQKARIQ